MARNFCDARILLLAAAAAFIFIQMRLFATQSEYADRLAAAVESENGCTNQMRSLIDQISMQQGKIVALEEKRRQDEEFGQLKALIHDLERKGMNKLFNTIKEPVAAVVIMACNRPDYLERTVQSILKYHNPVASKFPLFISQDGTNPDVKSKSLSYGEIQYMQDLQTGKTIGGGYEKGGVYILSTPMGLAATSSTSESTVFQWHLRLGHPSAPKFRSLLPNLSVPESFQCEACQLGKHTRTSFPSSLSPSSQGLFDLLHVDMWGPSRVAS